MTFSISIQSGIHVLLNQDVQVSPSFKIENFIYKVWEDKAWWAYQTNGRWEQVMVVEQFKE